MTFPEHDGEDPHPQYEDFDDWACAKCLKNISAARPPVLNADNCSCVGKAPQTFGGGGHYSEPATYQQPLYHYEETAPLYQNQPPSYASSSASVPCPEGPEHGTPNLQVNNNYNHYLPLVAEPGLNEIEYQHRASFNSDISYPMQQFLSDREAHQPYGTERVESDSSTTFLSQELYVQSSRKVHRGSPRSKLSWVSESSRSGEVSVVSWGMADPLNGLGGWDSGNQSAHSGEAYPMVMSGVTECAGFHEE